jgi:hypothetical protein
MRAQGWEEQVAMRASMAPAPGSLSFWRIEDVPFETYVAALDGWLGMTPGGELRVGGSVLVGPMEHDRDLGIRRVQVHLARGPLHPLVRMRLQIDRWSSSSTALELIPCRLVRPTADYFRAGRLLLDSLTGSFGVSRTGSGRPTGELQEPGAPVPRSAGPGRSAAGHSGVLAG